jgi:hypothetical protein
MINRQIIAMDSMFLAMAYVLFLVKSNLAKHG